MTALERKLKREYTRPGRDQSANRRWVFLNVGSQHFRVECGPTALGQTCMRTQLASALARLVEENRVPPKAANRMITVAEMVKLQYPERGEM